MNIKVSTTKLGVKAPFISHSKKECGITLIALIISIIILIILAAVSIKMITDGGILEVTDKGVSTYLAESQRERLVYALEAARIERERNKEFDKNTDVDEIIKNDIPEAEINGDIVAIGGIEFRIDRDKLDIIVTNLKEGEIPIYTAEQLQKIGTGEKVSINRITYEFENDKTYVLQNDIDLGGKNWNAIGSEAEPFTGIFEGNNHTITNLKIVGDKESEGLFAYNEGTIQNIKIKNANVTSTYDETGILVGTNKGTVNNITTSGIVEGKMFTGGVVGKEENGNISNCINRANISGTDYVGGIVGHNTSGNIQKCGNYGSATGVISVGGIAGAIDYGELKECCNKASIYSSGSGKPESRSAGIAGWIAHEAKVLDSYNVGTISGSNRWQRRNSWTMLVLFW